MSGVIREGFLWNPNDAGYAMVAVARMVLDGTPIKNGIEIPTLGQATVDETQHVIQVDRILTINKSTIGDLIEGGLWWDRPEAAVSHPQIVRRRSHAPGVHDVSGAARDLEALWRRHGAVERRDLDLARGEVHCLVGENGSGKSTLIKIIAGVQAPEPGGRIVIEGTRVSPPRRRSQSTACGIQVIYQDLSLFPNLTVAENIAVGRHLGRPQLVELGGDPRRPRPRRWRASASRSIPTPRSRTSRSPTGSSSRSAAPWPPTRKLVIMDEPTASLTRHEVDALLALVARSEAPAASASSSSATGSTR